MEPTHLPIPGLNRQQTALVLLEPGENYWGHERNFHRNCDRGVRPQPEPAEAESEGSALLAPAGLGQGLGRCTLQRSASQGQSKGEVGRESERG